jgi:hypothetical protein
MKIITKLSIVASIGLLLIIALSGCKSKGEGPVVVSNNEVTIAVGATEPDWTSLVIVEDDVDEEIIIDSSMIDLSNVNTRIIGIYTAIYNITDSDGNETTFELTVNVVDRTSPIVDLRGESFIYVTVGEEYVEEGIIIYDNYDKGLSYDVEGTVDTNTIGDYFLNYTVTDSSGNKSVKLTRLVVVENYKQMVSDKDEVYFSVGDFEITREDLYNEMIDPGGLYLLLDYVDSMLLSDYIVDVTNEELVDELNRLTFDTTDTDTINSLDPDVYQDSIDVFNNTLLEYGYNPGNTDDVNEYLSLNIAKRNALLYQYSNDELEPEFYTTNTALENYYNVTMKGDVCALELRFNTETEVKNVFNHFNLVTGFNDGFGLYYGETPIEDVENFSSINTTQLSNEETFGYFVQIYNYLNQGNTQLPVDITKENLCLDYPELVTYSYSEVLDEYSDNTIYLDYVDYIFEDLHTLYDIYSYEPMTFGQNEMFVYKISHSEVTDFDDLTETELTELDLEYVTLRALESETFIEDYMIALRLENEFNIVEQFLGVLYQSQYLQEMDSYKDPTIMATLGETEISVDTFYDHVESRLGYKYTIYLKGINNLLTNGVYEELYGDNFDVLTNDSEEIIGYRAQLQQIKDCFELERYVSYGYSSFEYTWNEFMFLALNSTNETEALMNLLVFQTLTEPNVMSDFDFNLVSEFIQEQYDDFFDLNVEHLLLYIDFDNDFVPDNYLEYIEGLDETETLEFNDLISSFDSLVRTKFESGSSLEDIVDEFNNGLLNDESNDWVSYREYGFKLLTEDLTYTGESLSLSSTTNFDSAFRNSLIRIYDEYSSLEEIPDSYLDPSYTNSTFGMHIILATKGNNFDQPSAYFDQSNSEVVYSEGSNNLTDLPTQEQLTLFKTIIIAEQSGLETDVTLPDSVYEAIEYYYLPVFSNSVYANTFLIEAAQDIVDGDSLFMISNTENMAKVLEFYESLLESITE